MKLYNSLTHQVDDVVPRKQSSIQMYSCGPTVYSNLHIGNLASFIYADLLRRVLASQGYDVVAVMNITDVDDKTIRDSRRDYPNDDPMTALQKLTKKYEDVFIEDIERIGIDTKALTFIRAQESIEHMNALTQKLLDNGIAYLADDGVYFSIMEYELSGHTYGVLQHIDRSSEQARVANDEYDKDSASDFALWKRAEPGEPAWEGVFRTQEGTITMLGRPGWHIECSAMSKALLDVPFDIHTGGIDLKFPHHENEIAQSIGALGTDALATHFVHNNHILIDGKKMSKSLGNTVTLRTIEENAIDPTAFRLLVLSSHYRSESNFTWEILTAHNNRLKNIKETIVLRYQNCPHAEEVDFGAYTSEISAALANDLDTPRVLKTVAQLFDTLANGIHDHQKETFDEFLRYLDAVLGLTLSEVKDVEDSVKDLLQMRSDARDDKDWDTSDKLRDQLADVGVGVRDATSGQYWYYL